MEEHSTWANVSCPIDIVGFIFLDPMFAVRPRNFFWMLFSFYTAETSRLATLSISVVHWVERHVSHSLLKEDRILLGSQFDKEVLTFCLRWIYIHFSGMNCVVVDEHYISVAISSHCSSSNSPFKIVELIFLDELHDARPLFVKILPPVPVAKKARLASDHTLKSYANVVHRQAESPTRKATPERKSTPLRGKNASNHSANSKPIEISQKLVDQHRWPSRLNGKGCVGVLTRSMDLSNKASRSALSFSMRGASPVRRPVALDTTIRNLQKSSREVSRHISLEGCRKIEYESCSIGDLFSRTGRPLKFLPLGSSSIQSSQLPVIGHPPSPTTVSLTTPNISRGNLSPCRTRLSLPFTLANSTVGQSISSTSILNFSADVLKGKRGPNHIEDAHLMRLLYNRSFHWRFVNEHAETTLTSQGLMAEDLLYNVWKATSELRDSITMKRITLQQLRRDMKLDSLRIEQITYLDDWAVMDRQHSMSLAGSTDAWEACSLHLPVTGGARADVQMVKDSFGSVVDVMQAMGSSMYHLLSRVKEMNSLVSELATVAALERVMLDECGDLLASTTAMQQCGDLLTFISLGGCPSFVAQRADTDTAVASLEGYLIDRDVLTTSFAP